MKNKNILNLGLIAAIVLVGLFLIVNLTDDTRSYREVDTSIALQQLDGHNIKEARIDDREQRLLLELKKPITVEKTEGIEKIVTQYPARTTPDIFERVNRAEPEKFATKVTRDSFLGSMLAMVLPVLLIFGLLMFFLTRMQGGGMGMFGFGGSKAKELTKDMPTNTFADVAGADEAVDELQEIKDFLQDPTIYEKLGAKIPRGVLLYGPPGTGKTLLARAVAGEAGVPFYSISGSDFVEMFVGVGASRVRDLFKQAKENSPCIIFVDEIDAVGRQRGAGMGGGHDEREQTLNQLLVEMDGFGDRQGVILMAATNRPDILDPALLRPGRFDRQIPVTNPDLKGREKILEVHAKGKPFAPDADLKALAKRTAGMSGADLANVLNEAALLTARIGGNVITADALEEATDRVIGGPRRSSKVISEQEKKITAYHEGGHTLSAWALKDIERVYKVTILARGRTGGHAMTAQEDDKGMYNRKELFARLVFAMGGRSAEELVFGSPTTGASADIEQATKIARAMVTEYGMSPELGMVKYGEEQGDPFAGLGRGGSIEYSEKVAATIDDEVRYLLSKAHETSYAILREHRETLDALAYKLLQKETLRRPDLEVLFEHIEPRSVDEVFPGEELRFPQQSGYEPVKTPVEEAIERGEEPPKPFSLLEASKAARARREAHMAKRKQELSPVAPEQGPRQSGYQGRHHSGSTPNYGTPPPAGWTVPGWPPSDSPGTAERTSENESSDQSAQQKPHPGMSNYGTAAPDGTDHSSWFSRSDTSTEAYSGKHGEKSADESAESVSPSEQPTELIGFRLPERERPDAPEKPSGSDEESAPASGADEIIPPTEHTSDGGETYGGSHRATDH